MPELLITFDLTVHWGQADGAQVLGRRGEHVPLGLDQGGVVQVQGVSALSFDLEFWVDYDICGLEDFALLHL